MPDSILKGVFIHFGHLRSSSTVIFLRKNPTTKCVEPLSLLEYIFPY